MRRRRLSLPWAIALAGVLLLVSWPARAEDAAGFGPLYDRFRLTLSEGDRTEILGPLISEQTEGTEETRAFAPLFSRRSDPETDFTEVDLLYPLITYDRFGLDYRLQFFQIFSFAGGTTMEFQSKRRVSLFPLFFSQRSSDPALNYTAVVPFYGHLENRFFRDELSFVMFPLYLRSRKRDVVTDNYLFPIFHKRHGPGMTGWQAWPLIGREHKDVTTRTNQYDEVETIGGHDKLFVIWPLFYRNDLGIGTTNLQTQRLFLPFYSSQQSPSRDTTSYLWPLGFTFTEDREKKYREWGAPWPLIAFARGEGKTLDRVWPFFSHGKTANVQSDFFLWPVYKYNRITSEALDRQRTRFLFFLYSDLVERNTVSGTAMKRRDLWPLFTARQDHNGNKRLQILAPLEPLLPSNPGVERTYSPFWSIWRSERNGKTGAASQSLLWNLYRRDTTESTRKCSLLFGLFHYQSGPEGKRWRLFYVPVRKNANNVNAPAIEQTRYVPEHR